MPKALPKAARAVEGVWTGRPEALAKFGSVPLHGHPFRPCKNSGVGLTANIAAASPYSEHCGIATARCVSSLDLAAACKLPVKTSR